MNEKQFIPILFGVLFGFVVLNIVINFILLVINKRRIYKLLCTFWPSVLAVFILQSIFQTGPLPIALAYSATFLPMTIFCMIGFEALGRKFPLRNYLVYYAASVAMALTLYASGFGFTTIAMPLAIASGTPLIHTFIYMNVIDRNHTTVLQKFLGVMYFLLPVHCINFAVFRMDETQLWGWLVSYALYDALAVLLPSIALELANITENARLNVLIKERTLELEKSHKENEGLLKILLHDVSNPLMSLKFFFHRFKQDSTLDTALIDKMQLSMSSMEGIIQNTKERYQLKASKKNFPLMPIDLETAFEEVASIFAESLARKNVELRFVNDLTPGKMILADKISFTSSVLGNLISNALKYSSPDDVITVSAREVGEKILLEVRDQGPGINDDVLAQLAQDRSVKSTPGLLGESGSGYGLSIVKSFVSTYGGDLEFKTLKGDHSTGTNVRITLAATDLSYVQ